MRFTFKLRNEHGKEVLIYDGNDANVVEALANAARESGHDYSWSLSPIMGNSLPVVQLSNMSPIQPEGA